MHVTIDVARAYMRDMRREADVARGRYGLPMTARVREFLRRRVSH
jgi:hypothetical protein